MNIQIRTERLEDYDAIRKVNDAAFGQPNAGRLIERLRQLPEFIPEVLSMIRFPPCCSVENHLPLPGCGRGIYGIGTTGRDFERHKRYGSFPTAFRGGLKRFRHKAGSNRLAAMQFPADNGQDKPQRKAQHEP